MLDCFPAGRANLAGGTKRKAVGGGGVSGGRKEKKGEVQVKRQRRGDPQLERKPGAASGLESQSNEKRLG